MRRFYSLLLRLYPASHRAEYGAEMRAVFADRVRGYRGPLGALRAAGEAVGDVVPNAIAAHWELLRQDVRLALRAMRRSPGFALTAVLVVALGVGANTAAFSLADLVLLRPLPFPEPERLVKLWQSTPGGGRNEISPTILRDWRASTRAFESMAGYTWRAANLTGRGDPVRIETARVTPELMRTLGTGAWAGRTIVPDDSAGGAVVVLSWALWQSQFGGANEIIGESVNMDGLPHVVVGVMPPDFRFPSRDIQAWAPLVFRDDDYDEVNDTYITGVARLRPGVSLAQAQGELDVVAARMVRQYPKELEDTGAWAMLMSDEVSERSRMLVLALSGAAACVLLLACANLGSLLLARSAYRERELAVRAALGAGRERLVRQLLTESAVLAVVGGLLGVALASAVLPLLAQLVPGSLPIAERPSLDGRVLAVAVVMMVGTALLLGFAPAARTGQGGALDALRSGARAGARSARLRAALVVVEISASVVLLVTAGLLMRTLWRIQNTDPGFDAERVMAVRTALPQPKYEGTLVRVRFYDRVLGEVRALPGVESAAYVTGLPLDHRGGIWSASFPGREETRDPDNAASLRYVSPGYFATMGIPLRAGRDIDVTDAQDRPGVAVVSEAFAKRHWPNESALGRRFNYANAERTVVGVVGEIRVRGLERESEPQVYLSYAQVPDGAIISYPPKELVVRASVPPATLLPAIRRAVRLADPDQPVSHVRTLDELVSGETASRATQLRLLATFAAIALLIAGVGIHGLLAFTVSQRMRELGVRRALGAQRGTLIGGVVREGALLAGIGITVGVVAAWSAARAIGALLVGVEPHDPLIFTGAAALCAITAVLGCLRPAGRAASVDPAVALRSE